MTNDVRKGASFRTRVETRDLEGENLFNRSILSESFSVSLQKPGKDPEKAKSKSSSSSCYSWAQLYRFSLVYSSGQKIGQNAAQI